MEEHGGPVRVGSERENRHSRLGIASFIIAIVATLVIVIAFVVIFTAGAELAGGANPQALTPQELQRNLEDSPGSAAAVLAAGIGLLASPVLYLLGSVLGIAGLVQGRRKRLFAIIGTVANGLAFLAIAGLFVLSAVLAGGIAPAG